MNLLVTGACGFIGSNFVRYWKREHPEDRVSVLDSLVYGSDIHNLDGLDVPLFKMDIRDQPMVSFAMLDIDTVVHFAAQSHVDHSIKSAIDFATTNVVGTQVLLEEAVRAGVKRFHHVSTDEVFGHLPEGGKFHEESPYAPRNPYAATKAGSDHLVRAAVNSTGLHATISNCSNNYGPRQALDKLVPKAITYALENKPFPLYGAGNQVRDWLHVDDHCRAIDLILQHGKAGSSYVIGGDTEMTNLEVVTKIYELCGQEPNIVSVQDRPGHDFRYAIEHRKISEELGWQPSVSFEDGMKSVVDWYRSRNQRSTNSKEAD